MKSKKLKAMYKHFNGSKVEYKKTNQGIGYFVNDKFIGNKDKLEKNFYNMAINVL